MCSYVLLFFKEKTAYEWRISDWSSDVCSSDLRTGGGLPALRLLHPLRAKPYPLPPSRRDAARKDRDRQPLAARVRGNLGRLAVADRQQPTPDPCLAASGLCARRHRREPRGHSAAAGALRRCLGNRPFPEKPPRQDRKSTRLNYTH